DEPLTWHEIDDFVGVCHSPPEKVGHERHARSVRDRGLRLPLDSLDVDVPLGGTVRVCCVGGSHAGRAVDDDAGRDVDVHRFARGFYLPGATIGVPVLLCLVGPLSTLAATDAPSCRFACVTTGRRSSCDWTGSQCVHTP